MTHEHDADKQLANAVCSGDPAAFDRFFEAQYDRLYRFALGRVSGDADLARDMVQQVMIKAIHSLANYRAEASLFTWLCYQCRGEISAHRRKAQRRGRVVVPLDTAGADFDLEQVADMSEGEPQQRMAAADRAQAIHDLLDSLPGRYGDLLELKYIEGLSMDEIAQRLGTGVTAIQSQLQRARRAFREAAEAAGLDIDE